eukprot:11159818-Lingulodinium_polyedra.AAC.1
MSQRVKRERDQHGRDLHAAAEGALPLRAQARGQRGHSPRPPRKPAAEDLVGQGPRSTAAVRC